VTQPKWMESFDQAVADRFISMNDSGGGLPGYLGFRFAAFEPGRLRAEMKVRDELLTPFGNIHGGVLAAFCDHVLGCVCYPHMKHGQWAATTEFKINYLAPVSGGMLEADAQIVSLTRTTAVVRIEIRNESRTAGVAQGTVLIRDPR
jgi:1,4-dihydroxy-2-naphthoyl-CoA hydrolase